jgi:hypothetical protein
MRWTLSRVSNVVSHLVGPDLGLQLTTRSVNPVRPNRTRSRGTNDIASQAGLVSASSGNHFQGGPVRSVHARLGLTRTVERVLIIKVQPSLQIPVSASTSSSRRLQAFEPSATTTHHDRSALFDFSSHLPPQPPLPDISLRSGRIPLCCCLWRSCLLDPSCLCPPGSLHRL